MYTVYITGTWGMDHGHPLSYTQREMNTSQIRKIGGGMIIIYAQSACSIKCEDNEQ